MRHCVAQRASSVHDSPLTHKGCRQIQESLSRTVNLKEKKHLRMGSSPWRNVLSGTAVTPICELQVGLAAALGILLHQSLMGDTFAVGTMFSLVERQSRSPKTTHGVLQCVRMWQTTTELSFNSSCEIAIWMIVKLRACCGSTLANVTSQL